MKKINKFFIPLAALAFSFNSTSINKDTVPRSFNTNASLSEIGVNAERINSMDSMLQSFVVDSAEIKPVIAVYPAWKHDENSIKDLPWQRFSHLAITGVYPQEDGNLLTKSVDFFLQELIKESHANGKKVVLSIGGAGKASEGFLEIAKSEEKLNTFINNVLDCVKEYKIDGIDIDWEFWTYQSKLNRGGQDPFESTQLVNLMKLLRQHLPKSALLTVDIAPGDWVGEQYQTKLQEHVDYVNLMAFDFTGAWKTSRIGYHSDLSTFIKSLDYVLKRGFDPQKVIVGLPAYGIEFINGKNKEIRHIDYKDIVEILDNNEKRLAKSRVNNLYFENRESIETKCALINKKKMAGIFIFTILSDHKSDKFSLLEACNRLIKPERISSKNN